MRRIPLRHMVNLRDLGGYPTQDGRVTQFGRYLRGDAPVRLSEDELQLLRDMRVTTIIDLRSDQEVRDVPGAFCGQAGFAYFHMPLYLGNQMPTCEADVPGMYFQMADEQTTVAAVMRRIAEAPGGVLYHCSAGKDRTGVISALLLGLAGVAQNDILADYQVSYTYLRPIIQNFMAEIADIPMYMLHSRMEYMEGFLQAFYEKYGSTMEYLRAIGLSDAEIKVICDKLMV